MKVYDELYKDILENIWSENLNINTKDEAKSIHELLNLSELDVTRIKKCRELIKYKLTTLRNEFTAEKLNNLTLDQLRNLELTILTLTVVDKMCIFLCLEKE